jgi:hypothetical protein
MLAVPFVESMRDYAHLADLMGCAADVHAVECI